MARPLLIANPHNATIDELKQVWRVGANETATRCTAVQMLLDVIDNPQKTQQTTAIGTLF